VASEEDPAAAERVWTMTVHVVKYNSGMFEIFVYDPDGVEIVHAPLVPDATSMEDALARFWRNMDDIAPEIASPFN
jgi:hypothetical protein